MPLPRKITPEQFADKLRTWRGSRSRKEAAEILDVPEKTLESWELGARKASRFAIQALLPLLK